MDAGIDAILAYVQACNDAKKDIDMKAMTDGMADCAMASMMFGCDTDLSAQAPDFPSPTYVKQLCCKTCDACPARRLGSHQAGNAAVTSYLNCVASKCLDMDDTYIAELVKAAEPTFTDTASLTCAKMKENVLAKSGETDAAKACYATTFDGYLLEMGDAMQALPLMEVFTNFKIIHACCASCGGTSTTTTAAKKTEADPATRAQIGGLVAMVMLAVVSSLSN